MVADDDWRLTQHQDSLRGVTLMRKQWRAPAPAWDHDHCEFCWAKFAEFEGVDILHEGWTTPDEYHWICDTCFTDFRERFEWRVNDD